MVITIASPVIFENDAIGNDVLQQFFCLKQLGLDVYLYAEEAGPKYARFILPKPKLEKFLSDSNHVLIYHHGTYWESGENIVMPAKCIIYLRYHNVTPPIFFENYSNAHYEATKAGRAQTERFLCSNKIHRYLSTSVFNKQELLMHGADEKFVSVVPPFHKISDFDTVRTNANLLETLKDGKTNILFVGRIAPNKGFDHLVEVIKVYVDLYDRNIRLNLVGGLDSALIRYYDEICNRISYYGLDDIIYFRHKVTFEDLNTYYKASDVFLLMSEHEGFCVPILEAQYHGLPILALDRCAVGETLGPNQIVVKDADYVFFASAIHVIASDQVFSRVIGEHGSNNYNNYTQPKLCETFTKTLLETN